MERAARVRYRAAMRALWASVLVLALAACGSSHSATSTDAPGSGGDSGASDGNGGGGDGSGGPATVKLTLTDRPSNAAMFSFLVAYQDGSGPWTLAPAPSGDTYSLPIHSPVYSVAWTCIATAAGGGTGGATQLRQVSLASFAVAERSSLTMTIPPRCTDRISRVALTGNLTGTNGGFYLVTAGDRTVFAANGAYSMELPPGTYDVFALRAGPGSGAGALVVDQAAVVRGVAITAATTQDLDFTTAEATQSFPVTVQNAATARVQATTTLYTANGSSPTLVTTSTAPLQTEALAAAQGASGDVYLQAVQVADGGGTETVESWTGVPAAQDVTPPAAQGGATSTVPTSTPYPEVMTTWAAYSGATGYAWIATQPLGAQQCGGQNACAVVWSALLSPGVTGASPAFEMPDLSALAGWRSELQLVPGSAVNGRLDAFTSSAGASDFPPVTPAASGTQRTTAEGRWTVTP